MHRPKRPVVVPPQCRDRAAAKLIGMYRHPFIPHHHHRPRRRRLIRFYDNRVAVEVGEGPLKPDERFR